MSYLMKMTECCVKCEKPVAGRYRLPKNKNGYYNDFVELMIAIENDEIVIKRYDEKAFYKLPVKEGVFEGADMGEWGCIVRFRPYAPENYISVQRPCIICGSTAENCCVFDIKARNPDERNVFKDMEGVDFLKFNGVGNFLYSPRGDTSMFSVIAENCYGFFKIGDRNFTITGSTYSPVKIYELIVNQNEVVANKTLDIENVVQSFLSIEDQKTAYIATNTSLLAFKDDKLTKLLDFSSSPFFHIGSIVYLDGCVYIGMRNGYICQYNIETEESKWYRYTGQNL